VPIVSGPGTVTAPNPLRLRAKLDENGNVAGFYTNRTDGLKIDHNMIY